MNVLQRCAGVLALLTTPMSFASVSTLADAVRAGDIGIVSEMLVNDEDANAQGGQFTPLAIAAVRGDLPMVDLLLNHDADPNGASLNGANALSIAVRSCRATDDLIKRLVSAGSDLENRSGVGITPLMLAVQEEMTDVAILLMDAGADVQTLNPFGEGILNYAIYTKNNTLIKEALERGVDSDQMTKLFTTVDYDPPGIGSAVSHHSVLCAR